jgi:hypothetical protein
MAYTGTTYNLEVDLLTAGIQAHEVVELAVYLYKETKCRVSCSICVVTSNL